MNGDSYQIVRAEGGFIVHVNKKAELSSETSVVVGDGYVPRVFTDSSSLLNYLHNELVGSN